jgi:hypothetical protein
LNPCETPPSKTNAIAKIDPLNIGVITLVIKSIESVIQTNKNSITANLPFITPLIYFNAAL